MKLYASEEMGSFIIYASDKEQAIECAVDYARKSDQLNSSNEKDFLKHLKESLKEVGALAPKIIAGNILYPSVQIESENYTNYAE